MSDYKTRALTALPSDVDELKAMVCFLCDKNAMQVDEFAWVWSQIKEAQTLRDPELYAAKYLNGDWSRAS